MCSSLYKITLAKNKPWQTIMFATAFLSVFYCYLTISDSLVTASCKPSAFLPPAVAK